MPALLKAKVVPTDEIQITLIKGSKEGFMIKGEFHNELGLVTSKIFPTESLAKSHAQGQEVIKVNVTWQP